MTTEVGPMLRGWRERRRLSQLHLAGAAQVSTRHLSCVETGKARPTSDMILRLAEELDVPLRQRNALLLAGGYAPAFPEHGLGETPMAAISQAIAQVLRAHEPFPTVVVDHHWELIDANDSAGLLLVDVAAHLLEPPVNVLRLTLHPEGMAPRVLNLGEWRAHLLHGLRRQVDVTGDAVSAALLDELEALPGPAPTHAPPSLVVPLHFRSALGDLRLMSMTTVFGTPRDVTLAELAIESFYPGRRRHGRAAAPTSVACWP